MILMKQRLKRSMLNLTIVGIIFDKHNKKSYAIIRMASGEEKTFHVGDKLTEDVLIKRITVDGILINRNGMLESLSLPKENLIFEAFPKPLIKD